MRLDLTVDPNDTIDLYVNGQYQAHISVGMTEPRDTLQAQVQAAHALRSLAYLVAALPRALARAVAHPDQAERTPAKREAAFWRGLVAGLEGVTVRHPTQPGLPGVPPEHSASYRDGYAEGEAYRRCLALQEAPPHADGTPCTCVPGTAGWWRHHWSAAQLPPGMEAVWDVIAEEGAHGETA